MTLNLKAALAAAKKGNGNEQGSAAGNAATDATGARPATGDNTDAGHGQESRSDARSGDDAIRKTLVERDEASANGLREATESRGIACVGEGQGGNPQGAPADGEVTPSLPPLFSTLSAWNAVVEEQARSKRPGRSPENVYLQEPPEADAAEPDDTSDDEPELLYTEAADLISYAGASIPETASRIDVTAVVCHKTGKIIQDVALADMDAVANPEYGLLRILSPLSAVSTAWLFDGAEDLDDLQQADLVGYAVYVSAKLAAIARKQSREFLATYTTAETPQEAAHDPAAVWCLARAHKWFELADGEDAEAAELRVQLEEFATLLSQCASFAPSFCRTWISKFHSKRQQAKRLPNASAHMIFACDEIAAAFITHPDETIAAFRSIYSDTLAGCLVGQAITAKSSRNVFGAQAGQTPMEAGSKGPSNIRRQRKNTKAIAYAQDFARAFAADADLSAILLGLGTPDKTPAKDRTTLGKKLILAQAAFASALTTADPTTTTLQAADPEIATEAADALLSGLDVLLADAEPVRLLAPDAPERDEPDEDSTNLADFFDQYDDESDAVSDAYEAFGIASDETDPDAIEVRVGRGAFEIKE